MAVSGLSLVAANRGGAQASHCWGFPCGGAQALGIQASVVATCGLSCLDACGIFLDQGLNPCPLHWQVDSYPLYHQGRSLGPFCKAWLLVGKFTVQCFSRCRAQALDLMLSSYHMWARRVGSSRTRDRTCVSCTGSGFFTAEPPGKPPSDPFLSPYPS